LEKLQKEHSFTHVVHLSGYTSAPMFAEDTEQKLVNKHPRIPQCPCARATSQSARRVRVDLKLLRAESQAVPGGHADHPGHAVQMSKITMENAAHTYNLEYGVRANGLRFFSVYGRTSGTSTIREQHQPIPLVDRNGVSPVVFATDRRRGTSRTSETSSTGSLAILEKGTASDVYNIGTGKENSFNEMIQTINEELGTSVKPRYVVNPLKNYVQATLADPSKIEKEIGWKAKTSLRQGIKKVIAAKEPFSSSRG